MVRTQEQIQLLEDIKLAYLKLKSAVYFDTSNTLSPLRLDISKFETKSTLDKKQIFENISNVLLDEYEIGDYIEDLMKSQNRKYYIIPKVIQHRKNEKDNLITNNRVYDDNNIEKVNIMINAPIEIHIISVLWLMKIGYKLDLMLDDNCFGNRLIIKENEEGIVGGRGLFKPYVKQYQNWRDQSILTAKKQLELGIDIAFVSLDITEYYYRIKFVWDDLNNLLQLKKRRDKNLNYALQLIHQIYSHNMFRAFSTMYDFSERGKKSYKSIKEVLLPIGLQSSPVLANFYLKRFDQIVKEKLKPTYYGRYVDDILIVINKPNKTSDISLNNIQIEEIPKDIINIPESTKFIAGNLRSIFNIKYVPKGKSSDSTDISNYRLYLLEMNGLYIQNSKVMLYEFAANQSLSVIEKLKKDVEERASEFRFLSSDEDSSFDSDAYELLYDNSFGKPRTLKDYKENRYGISAYLTKRISASLRVDKANVKYETNKILDFFNGSNSIEYYQQWERVFTYLVINNKINELGKFLNCVLKEIKKIKDNFSNSDLRNDYGGDLRKCLYRYLKISMSVALALKPEIINRLQKKIDKFVKKELHFNTELIENLKEYSECIRQAGMIRHYYIPHSLLNYTNFSSKIKNGGGEVIFNSLIDPSLTWENIDSPDILDIKNNLQSPRRIKFYEACILRFQQNLIRFNVEHSNGKVDYNEKDFLQDAYKLYKRLNDFENVPKENEIIKMFGNSKIPEIIELECGLKNSEISDFCISLANTKVEWEKHCYESLKGKPILSRERQLKLSNILNKYEIETPKSSMLVLPENSVPHDWLSYIASFCVPRQKAAIFGLEHIKVIDTCSNYVITILPVELNGIKDAIVIPRLKNNYSYEEAHTITNLYMTAIEPKVQHYNLFHWNNLYFTLFYCFELADIRHRALFRSKIDFMVVSEFNQDVNYFSNIVEASARDLGCFMIQVNSADFGDSRVTQPKKTELIDILKVKGGENDVILIAKLNIKSYREHQEMKYSSNRNQKDLKPWKPTPPNFDVANVKKRIKNNSIHDQL
ncbi:MAG: RNA-directed DNA polymerase [Ignavibacteria bacterium]|nr:RNA-directed DNA polymerase [Ignavibacteria bacterium]